MKKVPTKAIADVHKTGTHVPEKDFSSSKKIAAAAGTGGSTKGSMTSTKKLGSEKATSTPVSSEPVDARKYDGSSEDWSSDYHVAKRRGISVSDHEDSARDRVADVAGQRRFDADESKNIQHVSGYKKGVSAFSNKPKTSSGFGHPPSACDGHLRCSGHSSAHRIGKR
jgi:hypothetical protein